MGNPIGVYVISIEGIDHAWINDLKNVVEVCKFIINVSSPSSNYELHIVSSLSELNILIDDAPKDVIIINGHGETMPIPENQINDWKQYLEKITYNISHNGWIWVSITGVPFFYTASGPKGIERGIEGTNTVLEKFGGSVIGWFETLMSLTKTGRKLSMIYEAYDIPEIVICSKSLIFKGEHVPIPTRSLYSAGIVHGICSYALGKGFLIMCNLISTGLGLTFSEDKIQRAKPNDTYDCFMTKLSLIFALYIRKTYLSAKDVLTNTINNEDAFREHIIVPMLRMEGFHHVVDLHRIAKNTEQGKDIIAFTRDPFGKEIIYGFQIKAKDIGVGDVKNISDQIHRGFTTPFADTYFRQDVCPHYMYVITSCDYTGPAKDNLIRGITSGALGVQFKEYIRFLNGEDILEELERIDF